METCLTAVTGAIATRMENERSLDLEDEFDKASSVYTSTDDVNECISSVVIATVMDRHDETQVRSIQKPITRVCDVSEGLTRREILSTSREARVHRASSNERDHVTTRAMVSW
jgi:hypothetical protein